MDTTTAPTKPTAESLHGAIVGYARGHAKAAVPCRNRNGKMSVRISFVNGVADDGSVIGLKDAWLSLEGGAGQITATQLREAGFRPEHFGRAVPVLKDGAPVLDPVTGQPVLHSEIPDLSNTGINVRVRIYADGATEAVSNGVVDNHAAAVLAGLFAGAPQAAPTALP